MSPETKTKKREMKIYYNPEMDDMPFPEPASYKLLVGKPEGLKDINPAEGGKLTGIEAGADVTGDHDCQNPLVDLSVTTEKLAAAAVEWDKIADEAIKANNIWTGGNVITLSAQIKDATILNAHIGNAEIQSAKIGSLDANVINAGTLTARTIRTQDSGQRVEMRGHGDAYPDELLFYNSNADLTLEIFGGVSETVIQGNLDVRPVAFQGLLGHYAWKIYETYVDACSQKIKNLATPTTDYDAATKKYVDDNIGGVDPHKTTHYAGGADAVIRTSQSSGSNLGISAGWAYSHDNNASAHHSKYTDANARDAITGNTLPGNIIMGGNDITDLDDIYLDDIWHGTTNIIDFQNNYPLLFTRIDMNNHNVDGIDTLSFDVNTGSPGAAGQMQYYDSGGTQQMRVKVGTYVGSIDLSNV